MKDMGFSLPFHLSYKFRLLVLFTLCLTVLGWATSNYFVSVIQEIPKAKIFVVDFNQAVDLEEKEALASEASRKKAELGNCPLVPPNLSKCSFFFFNLSKILCKPLFNIGTKI